MCGGGGGGGGGVCGGGVCVCVWSEWTLEGWVGVMFGHTHLANPTPLLTPDWSLSTLVDMTLP